MKILLVISLSLNLLLIGYTLMGGSNSTSAPDSELIKFSAASYQTYDQISQSQRERIASLVELELISGPANSSPATYYWEPNSRVVLEMMEEQQRNAQWIRAQLLSAYGEQAIDEPSFAAYFYPLGPGFEFMSSDQQIAVSVLRDQHRASLTGIAGGMQSFAEFQAREAEYLSRVQALLGEDAFFEFQLRESQLAQQMKNSGFDWSESEFRSVFAARSQSTMGASNVTMSASLYNDDVKTALGEDRYFEYLKLNDSTFQRIAAEVSRSGGSDSDAEAAYEVYVEYAELISYAAKDKDLVLLQQLQADRDQIIKEQVGITMRQLGDRAFSMPDTGDLRVN